MILGGVNMAMEDILLNNIATYKDRYEYYNCKGNEEKCSEYTSLILSEIEKLLALKDIKVIKE